MASERHVERLRTFMTHRLAPGLPTIAEDATERCLAPEYVSRKLAAFLKMFPGEHDQLDSEVIAALESGELDEAIAGMLGYA